MKLEELLGIDNLSDMPTEDLKELLRKIRHNRTNEDTVAQKAEKRSTKKAAAKFLDKLSPAEIATLKELMLKES